MASERIEPTVTQATFAPFNTAWRLSLAVLVMWFAHMTSHAVWVRLQHLDAREHIQGQIDYYIPQSDPTGLASRMAHDSADLITALGLTKLISPQAIESEHDADMRLAPAIQRGLWGTFRPEITAAIYSTILYAAKLGVILSLIPLCILWLFAFAVDGLVQRYIRRACAGRESATVYHRAKLYGFKLLPPLAAVIFLCSPVALHPGLVFLPAALLSAVLIRLQATYYKKYL